MKFAILFPIFLATIAAGQPPKSADSPLEVLEFKWFPDRQAPPRSDVVVTVPARAVIAENKNFQRKAREQGTPGTLDPNEHTIDGRSAAMEKIVQESRSPKREAVNGFSYHAVVRNASESKTEIIFWEFRFKEIANPSNSVRRQFICAVKIKPGDKTDLRAFSLAGPSDTISTESLSSGSGKLFDEKVVINRIEYVNGAILQRHDWNYKELKSAIDRAIGTPWGKETCRAF